MGVNGMANGQGGAPRRGPQSWRTTRRRQSASANSAVLDFTDSAADLEANMPPPRAFPRRQAEKCEPPCWWRSTRRRGNGSAGRNCARLYPRRSWSSAAMAISLDQCEGVTYQYSFSCQASRRATPFRSPYVAMSQTSRPTACWYQNSSGRARKLRRGIPGGATTT